MVERGCACVTGKAGDEATWRIVSQKAQDTFMGSDAKDAVGEADDLRRAHPEAQVTDYGNALITAGFVDAHMHYPQTGIIASW